MTSLKRFLDGVSRRELWALGLIALVALAMRFAFVLLTTDHALAGDEREYDIQGRFIAEGMWFWSTTPYGDPHPSLWKAPGYPAWVGVLYTLLGPDPDRVFAVQAFVGPVTVILTWALARRLLGPSVGLVAAAIVAIHPFAWQFEVRLFAESLVTPLTLLFLLLVLERRPTARRAVVIGALLGLIVLLRPSGFYLAPAIVAAGVLEAGWRRGLLLSALALVAALVTIAPWTIRNYDISGELIPVSVQDAALYGVFNDDAANDPEYPWAWRYRTQRDRDILNPDRPIPDAELRGILRERAFEYIREQPLSVPKAFFWNGLSRFWDVRRPSHIVGEAVPTGRKRLPTQVGVGIHYVLLPLALLGLWLLRRRPSVVVPVLLIALGASLVYTADATTRYRAPFEPLIAILASSAALALWRQTKARTAPRRPAQPPPSR